MSARMFSLNMLIQGLGLRHGRACKTDPTAHSTKPGSREIARSSASLARSASPRATHALINPAGASPLRCERQTGVCALGPLLLAGLCLRADSNAVAALERRVRDQRSCD